LMRNRPWVLLVDFNDALHLQDHSAGGYEPNVAMFEFKECVQAMEGLESPFRKLLHNQGNLHERVNKIRIELDEAQKALDKDPSSSILHEVHAHYLLAFKEAQPKIEDKDNFELKGQFLNELRTNTFSGLDHEDANEHIEKGLEIADLFHIHNITIDHVMLRAFLMTLTEAISRASVSVMPLSTCLNLGIGKFVFPVDFIFLDMLEDVKASLILERPFLSTAYAKIDVFKRKITLRAREEKIIFKSVKHASSLIKKVYMLSLRERMELDLEARLMGETLVLNRSLDPYFGDYIELNNLNVPLKLKRDQVDDLMLTIKEGEVVKEFRARNNSRMEKLEYKRNNVVGALMNIPIFVGTFSVLTDFAVLEDTDDYRDEGMGDVILVNRF
nr:RNA-directed DNA polymerase, eukaryota, reverse transcriptase zinc-binding domain protein [Tanacetum cinerariifolium]